MNLIESDTDNPSVDFMPDRVSVCHSEFIFSIPSIQKHPHR